LILVSFVVAVNCWGHLGHSAIAQVAFNLLNKENQAAIKHYLGTYTLAQVAPDPDDFDHSTQGRWSAPLHYLNLPKNATGYTDADCPNPPSCVVKAIKNYTTILTGEGRNGPFCSSESNPNNVEPCALIFLTHFVGDIHQPLHCGYGYDEGGNLVPVDYYSIKTELHAVWDTYMIQNVTKSTENYTNLVTGITNIIHNSTNMINYYVNNMDVVTWADESFAFVRNQCYVYNASDLRNDNAEPQLGTWYLDHNIGTVFQRLTAASVRLATLLTDIFGKNKGSNAIGILKKAVEQKNRLSKVNFSKFNTNTDKFDAEKYKRKSK